MVFYEAPHKLYATLRDMLDVWGDRRIALVRELTQIPEEVVRTTLAKAVKRSKDDPFKGEIVLVIEGASAPEAAIYTLSLIHISLLRGFLFGRPYWPRPNGFIWKKALGGLQQNRHVRAHRGCPL